MRDKDLPFKIIMSDMDGTLLPPDKIITPKSLEMIERLQAADIKLCLASARPPKGMMRYIKQLDLNNICAGFNGSVIFGPHGHLYRDITLPLPLVQELISALLPHPIEIWLQDYETWLVEDASTELVIYEQGVTDVAPREVDNLLEHAMPVSRIVATGPDINLIASLEHSFNNSYKDQAAITRSSPYMLDITAPVATKGAALRAIAELYKIQPQQIIAIGDAENDISLLEESGLGIAMGHAPQALKNVASFVTDDNENEGWANAVEKIILPRL
ncbi:Cof-type HAD-IIB family hydrolase [Aristophania vespae]|uniref:Cof-type HAD-IIB family hydrolase n=1 Tax=Aristophania vespae TaxID=2697033 RepID=A0A6P1NFC9_9PROT|nr:Cof-type HAD-IIB family hydrolase [Aristophania vespae]QHI95260.1 Cof-type HAD-IIB family hydrolase [Aristophania vespae]UMM64508.1 Putative phosphatase [Aristophania vespae]